MNLNKKGQGMIEYIILIAIIAVASLGIVKILGNTITKKMTQITYALQGKSARAKSVPMPEVEKKHYEERGMEDFYESSDP